MGDRKEFSIILTAWGENPAAFKENLESICRQMKSTDELIVVLNFYDNDPSITNALQVIIENEERVSRWIRVSQNSGVARAWNIGVNLSEGDSCLIVNGDCLLGENALGLFKQALANENIGVVGVGGVRDGKKKVDSPGLAEAVYGHCFLVRALVFKEVGLFDNEFSPLADELEFCHRVTSAGWGVQIISNVRWEHECTISNQVGRDIIYFGRVINRRVLDENNNKRKLSCLQIKKQ